MVTASSKIQVWLISLSAILILVAGTYHLGESPAIWLDEGVYSQLGVNIAEAGQQAFQIAPGIFEHNSYISVGYPLLYPLAFSYKIFGTGVLQGRGVMVVFIVLFAAASYWYMRQLFGPWQAAFALLLLSSFAELYGNGKSILGEVPGLFFLVATLIALRYLEKGRYQHVFWYIATGILAGLCVATKPIFILLLAALFFTLILQYKKVSLSWKGFLAGFIAFTVPFAWWIYTQFGSDVTLRMLVLDYINPYSAQSGQVLMGQVIVRNLVRFFTETTPVYTALLTGAWAVALYVRRKTARLSAAELSAFIFCMLIIVAYLRLPGWYRYLFPATTIALLFFPSSVLSIFKYMQERWSVWKKLPWLPYAALALLFCAQLYQVMFSSYVSRQYASTHTHDGAAALAELPKSSSIFLYNLPELAVLLPSRNYYQYLEPAPGMAIGAGELAVLQKGVATFAVVSPKVYAANPALFAAYQPFENVSGFEILKRSP